jgi:hypothetical protein
MLRTSRIRRIAAIEATAIGEQVLVGQFWTDPEFKKAYLVVLNAM